MSTVSGHLQFWGKERGRKKRKGLEGEERKREREGRNWGHSLIFTWIDATDRDALDRLRVH